MPATPDAPLGVRLGLWLLLPLLFLALYLDGRHQVPEGLEFAAASAPRPPVTRLLPATLGGLARAGEVRHFGPDNLYEYINGHAEYFLSAGFRGLAVGEYGTAGEGQPALVVNLYDMGEALNAFGVFADEAGDRETVAVGSMGARSGQGLNFLQGRFYAQLSLFDPARSAEPAGAELASLLAGPSSGQALAFRFPDLGEVTETRFIKEDYRGLGFLDRVLERAFLRDGQEIQAFLVQGTATDIAALVSAFEHFFDEDGLSYQRLEREGLGFYTVADPYEGEWFFVPLENRLIGVYAPLEPALIAEIAAFARSRSAAPPGQGDS